MRLVSTKRAQSPPQSDPHACQKFTTLLCTGTGVVIEVIKKGVRIHHLLNNDEEYRLLTCCLVKSSIKYVHYMLHQIYQDIQPEMLPT